MRSILYIFSLCLLLAGCGHNSEIDRQMDAAEGLMLSAPDSSLLILDKIHVGDLSGKEQKARYALLKSMALDKNYIDTTTFDVLQPAINYYSSHGNPDQKLRTYYYEGRINQNAGRDEMAMQSFMKGLDNCGEITDSLTLANLFVAQGALFYSSYMMGDVYSNNLKAAEIYNAVGKSDYGFRSNLTAFHASTVMNDRPKADSLYAIIKPLAERNPEYARNFLPAENAYILRFGALESQRKLLRASVGDSTLSRDARLDLASGCVEINAPQLAMTYYSSVDTVGMQDFSRLKYLLIGAQVYKANEDYKRAFESIWDYQVIFDKVTLETFETKSKVAQEKHRQEKLSLENLHRRDSWIIGALLVILVLLVAVMTVIYKLRISRVKRHNAELECERQTSATENLRLRLTQLEAESETLRELASHPESVLDPAITAAIQQRIEILNGLIASSISNNDAYSKPYNEWLEKEMADRKKFMNSTRLAFKASHPKFISYLEEHGLNVDEINYLCLYAIGLKGKEVGAYMELRRHYNISSEIRKKLGIDEHETNIGIYIRKLMKRL